MKTVVRLTVLAVMTSLAVFFSAAAIGTLRKTEDPIPVEVYAQYRNEAGRIAVYRSGNNTPDRLTEIETAALRRADRAMLDKGIPAEDLGELLSLLEDLGS